MDNLIDYFGHYIMGVDYKAVADGAFINAFTFSILLFYVFNTILLLLISYKNIKNAFDKKAADISVIVILILCFLIFSPLFKFIILKSLVSNIPSIVVLVSFIVLAIFLILYLNENLKHLWLILLIFAAFYLLFVPISNAFFPNVNYNTDNQESYDTNDNLNSIEGFY